MARRNDGAGAKAAEQATAAASEAGRVLQASKPEPTPTVEQPQAKPKAAEKPVEPGKIEKLLSQRTHVRAMEEIAEKRGMNPKEEPTETIEAKPAKEEPALEQIAKEPEAQVPPKEEPKDEPKVVRVKVDGEEFDVPQTDIDDAGGVGPYRMNRAAENRLKKATEVLARAHQTIQTRQEPQKPQPTDEQFVAEQMDIIRFGTKEEGAKAWLSIMARTQKQPIDANAMQTQIEERMRNQTAVSKFKEEFADIAKNPDLWKFAQTLDIERRNELAKANAPAGSIDWMHEYRTIGNKIRSAFGRSSQPASTAATGDPSQSKEAKKASITTLPTASARAALPEEKVLTSEEQRQEAIAEARKRRGQSG